MEKIKNFIFEETLATYDRDCYSKDTLQGFIEELNAEIDLALECYYRFDDEERDYDLVQRAWDMYITVREHNLPIINALKTIVRER